MNGGGRAMRSRGTAAESEVGTRVRAARMSAPEEEDRQAEDGRREQATGREAEEQERCGELPCLRAELRERVRHEQLRRRMRRRPTGRLEQRRLEH